MEISTITIILFCGWSIALVNQVFSNKNNIKEIRKELDDLKEDIRSIEENKRS